MASGKITVTNLGKLGVVIDSTPLDPGTSDGSLARGQNATHDPQDGHAGGLRKRPGLARFNATAAGGSILGGIPMQVAGTGGAPATGGGAVIGTGDPATGLASGTGDGTGSPGGTFTGGAVASTAPGASLFNGGSSIFSGARLVIVGRNGSGGASIGGLGWWVSSKSLADVGTGLTSPGPPCEVYSYPPPGAPFTDEKGLHGFPSCVVSVNGVSSLFYAGAHGDQTTSTVSTVRKVTGAADTLVATIPSSASLEAFSDYPASPPLGTKRQAIMSMTVGYDNKIYITVKDKFDGQTTTGSVGRVFQLNPLTNALQELNTGASPVSPAVVYSKLPYIAQLFVVNGTPYTFVGDFKKNINNSASMDAIVMLADPNPKYALNDANFTDHCAITCMAEFNGRLFMGTGSYKTTPVYSALWSRSPSIDINSAAWTGAFTASGTAAGNGNYFCSMVVFNGALYASWINPGDVCKIYKLVPTAVGDPTVSTFTTSVALTPGQYPMYLFVDSGVLYAIGAQVASNTKQAYVTSDGTTWVDKSASLPALGVSSIPIPMLFGVDQ